MGLAESVLAARQPRQMERAWPVGVGSVPGLGSTWGHDQSQFAPEEYLDYVATSNEVFSAAMLRARLMSSLRLNLFKGCDADKKAMPDHPAQQLLSYVNPYWTSRRLARMDELCMCLLGHTCWAVEKGPDGKPAEIWWMKPSRVRPVPDEMNYLRGYIYEPQYGGPEVRFEPDEVVWFRYPNPLDEFSPLSPLAAARLAADAAAAMMRSNERMFKQGLQLAGLIVPPADKVTFSPKQAEELEDSLERRFSGADKAHRWAVMRYEAQFKQLQMTPKDAEFATGLQMTLRQVCNAYGIPAPLLNEPTGATVGNMPELTKTLWAHTLVPDSELRADEIVEQFLPRFGRGGPDYAEYDYSRVPALQEAQSEVWSRDAQALDRGAITINEWRRRNGLPDVQWGNAPWLPMNKGQYIDGALQIPGQPAGPPGPGQQTADGGPPGVPDDEVNPANQPAQSKGETVERMFDHHAARRLIAEAFGDRGRVNGYAHAR